MSSLNNDPAKRQRPVIRVFVSSTFSDLKAERDALARRVFPKLEQLCQTEGFQFQAIDLRWGVSEEATLDHRTMRICFEELRRSQEVSPQPNFLILLGNRYGWRPLPEAISIRQFEELASAAAKITTSHLDLGSPVEVLGEWYLRDDNNVPPVYVLQSRIGTLCESDKKRWERTEEVLWSIINQVYTPKSLDAHRFQQPLLPLEERFGQPAFPEIVRFQASATEQEIWGGALSVDHPEQHVLACFREIQNLDQLRSEKNPSGVDASGASEFLSVTNGWIDQRLTDAQQQLKNELRKRLEPDPVPPEQSRSFTLEGAELRERVDSSVRGDPAPRWSIDLSDAYRANIQKMCDWVMNRLETIIKQQIAEWRQLRNPAAAPNDSVEAHQTARDLEIERDEHLRLADEHTAHFVGRDEEGGPHERIQAYLDDSARLPLLIHGDSGCGKTALLSRAFKLADPESNPIIRFIGVTPKSSDIRSLLGNLCLELRQHETGSEPLEGGTPGKGLPPFQAQPLPTDIHELQQEFRQHLRTASEQQRPVVLFLDALDQLSEADGGLHLSWLPGRSSDPLPEGVKIVVSCLSDRNDDDPADRPLAILREVLPDDHVIELAALPLEDAKHLLDRWLSDASRTIGDENPNHETQRDLINRRLASDKQCRQPLFLKLLFEEVKLWRSYDENFRLYEPEPHEQVTTTDEAASPPRSNPHVDALLRQLFARLSASTNHGKPLVERALGYLAAARRGLSETEILEVLFADTDEKKEGYKDYLDKVSAENNHTLPDDPPRIPIAIWSRLRSDLAPYLAERSAPGGNVLTFYHRQVTEWVKAGFVAVADWKPHLALADYFDDRKIDTRQIDELPWHLLKAWQWPRLHEKLATSRFFDAVWNANEFDIKTYWTLLERHSPYRIVDTYRLENDLVNRIGDLHHWTCIGKLLYETGYLGAARTIVEPLSVRIRDEDDQGALQDTLILLGRILATLGDNSSALAAFQEVEQICRQSGDFHGLQESLAPQGNILRKQGDLDSARRIYDEHESICRATRDLNGLQVSLGDQVVLYSELKDYERVRILEAEEEQICRTIGNLDGLGRCLMNKTSRLLRENQIEAALRVAHEAEQIHREIGDRLYLTIDLKNLGDLHLLKRESTVAAMFYAEGEQLCRVLDNLGGAVAFMLDQGRAYAANKQHSAALRLFHDAAEYYEGLNNIQGRLAALRAMADVLREQEDVRGTIDVHRTMELEYRKLCDESEVAKCLFAQGAMHLTGDAYDPQRAFNLLREAADLCRSGDSSNMKAKVMEMLREAERRLKRSSQNKVQKVRKVDLIGKVIGGFKVEQLAAIEEGSAVYSVHDDFRERSFILRIGASNPLWKDTNVSLDSVNNLQEQADTIRESFHRRRSQFRQGSVFSQQWFDGEADFLCENHRARLILLNEPRILRRALGIEELDRLAAQHDIPFSVDSVRAAFVSLFLQFVSSLSGGQKEDLLREESVLLAYDKQFLHRVCEWIVEVDQRRGQGKQVDALKQVIAVIDTISFSNHLPVDHNVLMSLMGLQSKGKIRAEELLDTLYSKEFVYNLSPHHIRQFDALIEWQRNSKVPAEITSNYEWLSSEAKRVVNGDHLRGDGIDPEHIELLDIESHDLKSPAVCVEHSAFSLHLQV